MATLLDPRFKTDYIDEDEEKELVLERITEEAAEMIRKQKGQASEGENSAAAITPVSEHLLHRRVKSKLSEEMPKKSPNDTSSSLSRTPLERVQKEIESLRIFATTETRNSEHVVFFVQKFVAVFTLLIR